MLALLLALLVVTVAFGCLFAVRALAGRQWIERLGLGIQQFRGFRPVWRADRLTEYQRSGVGPSALVGRCCEATRDFDSLDSVWVGQVMLGGEIWAAEAPAPCRAGTQLLVTAVHGLTLRVTEQSRAA